MTRTAWAMVFALVACAPASSAEPRPELAVATFGGGCFWCMEPPYDRLAGVAETTSGFMGGHVEAPSYREVVAGDTGHTEVVQFRYDPRRVSYEELLFVYWRNVDPLVSDRQFCDVGSMYRPVIFVHDADQRREALASRAALDDSGRFERPIVVAIEAAEAFYPAEDYHQGYYRKDPIRYRFYRSRCGRDERLEELWGAEAGGVLPASPP